MSQLRAVLLGLLGHGKTFLFNKITLANEPVIYGGESLTKQIVIGQAAYGEFEIVDTPGFEAKEDKLLHAAGVIAGLAQGDVNRILIVVKCERIDIMINNIKKIIGPIQRYRDLITIIVSYWDVQQRDIMKNYKSIDSQQEQELVAKQKIEQKIKNEFNISSVIYTSLDDESKIITKMITDIILQSRFTKIQLSESEIYSQFDLLSLDEESETKFNESIKKIKIGFRKIAISSINYIKSLKLNDNDLMDKLYCLSLGIKDIAKDFIEKFEKEHGDYMNEAYDTDGVNIRYLHHIYLKKELRLDVEQVIKKAQERMKESQNHCFNFIKQCPYCELVWIKVVGCDGETTCGNRVNQSLDLFLSNFFQSKNYRIVIKNNSVDLEIEQRKRDANQLASKYNWDIFKILINSVKDDLRFIYNDEIFREDQQNLSQNQQNLSEDQSDQDNTLLTSQLFQIIDIYLNRRIGYQNLSELQFKMNEADLSMMVYELKFMLGESGFLKNQQNNKDQKVSFGCGKQIVWRDLPPLSGPLLKELLTPELINYFNDQEQLLQDEANDISKELEKTYKDLVNQAINEQMKNVKVIQKQSNQIQSQSNTEIEQIEQQQGKIEQNYQTLIEETKEKQKIIQERRMYSIKMMTDSNLYSDTETIDTFRIE